MTFSIIIPVYNVAPYLRECLDSVLAQTYTDWEAICVDDGSTDGSGAILDEYVAKDPRFKVVHQTNAGVSAARNAALEMVRGEWYLFLDGDDCVRNDALQILNNFGVADEIDGVLVSPYVPPLWEGGTIPERTITSEVLINDATNEDLILGPYAANGFPFNRLYRTTKFSNVRFRCDMTMAEDVCYWFDVLKMGARWKIIAAEFYLYRQRPDSVCGGKNPKNCIGEFEAVLHAFQAIDGGVLAEPDGKCKYFNRFPWAQVEYLALAANKPLKLTNHEWAVLRDKVSRVVDIVGWDRFGWFIELKFKLARYPLTRFLALFVDPCVKALVFIKHNSLDKIRRFL